MIPKLLTPEIHLHFLKQQPLRDGEHPHQQTALYVKKNYLPMMDEEA
ncbi:MAG: hypothetical protein V9821_00985 [Candidatus Dasytiphilus stammeri]